MKNFIKLLVLGTGVLFTSCSDVEPAIFNGQEGNDTFISFSRTLYSLRPYLGQGQKRHKK